MLRRAKFLSALAAGHEKLAVQGCFYHYTTASSDIEDANRELDEFFGVSRSSTSINGASTNTSRSPRSRSAHRAAVTDGGPAAVPPPDSTPSGPEPSISFSTSFSEAASAPDDTEPNLESGWDVAPSYGFAASTVSGKTAGWRGAAATQQPVLHPPPPVQPPRALTHIDSSGSASMVDVSQKLVTAREAQASCVVSLGDAYDLVAANSVAKGDVLKVAQLAGICGAKATATLIPLCHNIPISKVDVQLQLDAAARAVVIRALARTDGKTGVEMEALTAASVAALTVYDMCKAAAKDMVVGQLQLDYKSGGRSGTYLRAGLRRSDLLPSARPPL